MKVIRSMCHQPYCIPFLMQGPLSGATPLVGGVAHPWTRKSSQILSCKKKWSLLLFCKQKTTDFIN